MPEFVVGNTELGGGKLKKLKGFLKPNFEPGPNSSNKKTFYIVDTDLWSTMRAIKL
jgi:hypothetical protein